MKKIFLVGMICFSAFTYVTEYVNYSMTNETSASVVETVEYRVSPGDTLWSIAKAHNYNDQDIRKIVYEIQTYNGIGTVIHPGDVLHIPN